MHDRGRRRDGQVSEDHRRTVESGYDRMAEQYLASRDPYDPLALTALEDLASLPTGAVVLDLGCGAGVPVTGWLADRGFSVTGVDVSARQLELARTNVPAGIFLKADMIELIFAPESFDAVVAFHSIIHVPRAEHPALLADIHRWLKPEGLFLATMTVTDFEGRMRTGEVGERRWCGATTTVKPTLRCCARRASRFTAPSPTRALAPATPRPGSGSLRARDQWKVRRDDHNGSSGPRHPFSHLGEPRWLGRHEPGPRLLGRVCDPQDRRRPRRPRTYVHHRARKRAVCRGHRGAGAARRRKDARVVYAGHGRFLASRYGRQPAQVDRAGEGCDPPGDGGDRQCRLGPLCKERGQTPLETALGHGPGRAGFLRGLPLHNRCDHTRRGARHPERERSGEAGQGSRDAKGRLPRVHDERRLARLPGREGQARLAGGGGRWVGTR